MVGQTPHCRGTGEIIICGGRQEPRISYKGIIASLSRAIFNWPSPKLRGTWREETRERQSVKSGSWKKGESEGHYLSSRPAHGQEKQGRRGRGTFQSPHFSCAGDSTRHLNRGECVELICRAALDMISPPNTFLSPMDACVAPQVHVSFSFPVLYFLIFEELSLPNTIMALFKFVSI